MGEQVKCSGCNRELQKPEGTHAKYFMCLECSTRVVSAEVAEYEEMEGVEAIKCTLCEREYISPLGLSAESLFVCSKCIPDLIAIPSEAVLAPPQKPPRAPPPVPSPWPERDPFALAPEVKAEAYVKVRGEELNKIKRALLDGKLVVVTGKLGMGKTTLCEQIVQEFERESLTSEEGTPVVPVLIKGAACSKTDDFIRGILTELALDTNKDRAELMSMLIRWSTIHREKLVVLIDDASESMVDVSELGEFLRVLTDVEGVSILLNGEPGPVKNFLNKVRALHDRVQLQVELGPMSKEEIKQLVNRRAELAGVGDHITEDALEELCKLSKGVPRKVLKAASKAFELAAREHKPIDKKIVKKANKRGILNRLLGR